MKRFGSVVCPIGRTIDPIRKGGASAGNASTVTVTAAQSRISNGRDRKNCLDIPKHFYNSCDLVVLARPWEQR